MDLDYCPECELPTFSHEEVVLTHNEFVHLHCFEGTQLVVKREHLMKLPSKTN